MAATVQMITGTHVAPFMAKTFVGSPQLFGRIAVAVLNVNVRSMRESKTLSQNLLASQNKKVLL